jgi:hypothetical protein
MKSFLKFFIIIFATIICPTVLKANDDGELLWWMISDIDSISASDANGKTYSARDLGVNSARVRYDSTSGESGYLTLWGLDANRQPFQEPDSVGGVGIPAEYYASLASLSGDSASYSFVLELGNWSNGSWTKTSMESNSETYTDLVAKGHINTWDNFITPANAKAWTPAMYSVVPEPSSALLILIGSALLALRRRRA